MMEEIHKGLFCHCSRDIDPEIRMSCIQSLGAWTVSYPSKYVEDKYLKFLGWAFNDRDPGVRKALVLALQNLYDVCDRVPSLERFTECYSKRMLDLVYDIDISVAVCGISLVKQLLRRQLVPDNDDIRSLYDLLIENPPEIRRAAGSFVYDHGIARKFNSSQSGSSGDEGDTSQIHLIRMLQILRGFSTDQVQILYVIDDIWEFMDAMKDWKCIMSMLLDENSSTEFTDDDATNLTRLFCASVKKAVGEKIVPAADHRKHLHTKAQQIIRNSRKDITVTMMLNYPQLMRKYMADKAKVPSLLEIISYMDLELVCLKKRFEMFQSLLQLMKKTFFIHSDKDSLRSCVNAFIYCTARSPKEQHDFAQNELDGLVDELISKLTNAIREVVQGGDDEYPLLVNMKSLYELQLTRHVPIEGLYDDIIMALKNFLNKDDEVQNLNALHLTYQFSYSVSRFILLLLVFCFSTCICMFIGA